MLIFKYRKGGKLGMKGKIEAIYIDVDDCLWPTTGNLPDDFYTGLNKIHRYINAFNQGGFPIIGFCTGRDRNYCEAVFLSLGPPNSYSVVEHGIALFNARTKELILHPDLTEEKQRKFREISEKIIPRILKKYGGFEYPGNLICVDLELKRDSTREEIENYYFQIQKELSDYLDLLNSSYSSIAVEITPKGIDKAEGMKFMAKFTGINLKNVVGIGDSQGDFVWLKIVGRVSCPANAGEECKEFVKARNGYISPFSYASGVADIISHFTEEGFD